MVKGLLKKRVYVSQKYNFGTSSFQGTQKERITFFELSISKKMTTKPLSVESLFLECNGLTRHLCHQNQSKKGEEKFLKSEKKFMTYQIKTSRVLSVQEKNPNFKKNCRKTNI